MPRSYQHTSSLSLGGVELRALSACPFLFEESAEAYAPFRGPPARSSDLRRCDVEVVVESMPALTGMRLLFHAGRAWNVYEDPEGRRYVARYARGKKDVPCWVARIEDGGRHVTLYGDGGQLREAQGGAALVNPLCYPLDQILITMLLGAGDGVLVHAAGMNVDGAGALFVGRSGAGKSTISNLTAGEVGIRQLSDDRIIVRAAGEGLQMFGTPWPGDAGIAVNESVPLSALFFLEQSAVNDAHPIEPNEALERLLPTATIPWYDVAMMSASLEFCGRMVESVPCFLLEFRPEKNVIRPVKEVLQQVAAAVSSRSP